ncbi:hypothetical protein F4805DRAFT_479093 [Annulohypoxylon moriforme]|nr:hypothetical protein F4805DRAFT_479093 [Annulohypoxylon moriforme]
MVQKSSNVSSARDPKKVRIRSPDSTVWKGTKARDLVSGVRFSWDRYQNLYFVDFLETAGLGFKNADISPLLVQLNLDGYEDIKNDYGENVYDIIEVKVRRKIKNTADNLGVEWLKKASFKPKIVDPAPDEESDTVPEDKAPSQPQTPQHKIKAPAKASAKDLKPLFDFLGKSDSSRRDTPTQPAMPPQPNHPFLKMPKQKAPMTPSTPSSSAGSSSSSTLNHDINFEPKPIPTFSFQGSEDSASVRSTPPRTVKSEYSDYTPPSFEFKSPSASSKSTASRAGSSKTDEESSSKRSRAKRSIGRLISLLQRAEDALNEVEAAFDDLPAYEEGRELAKTISRLRSEFNGVQVDAEEVEDFATLKLKG